MAAYRRAYDSRHMQADCQEPGSAPEPYTRQSSMGYLYCCCARRAICSARVSYFFQQFFIILTYTRPVFARFAGLVELRLVRLIKVRFWAQYRFHCLSCHVVSCRQFKRNVKTRLPRRCFLLPPSLIGHLPPLWHLIADRLQTTALHRRSFDLWFLGVCWLYEYYRTSL